MLCLCALTALCASGGRACISHKQLTEEHRFDLSHKMSNLEGSRTNSKRVLQFSVGQENWGKVSASQMQQWCTGRARRSPEKMNMTEEDGGTDNKKF